MTPGPPDQALARSGSGSGRAVAVLVDLQGPKIRLGRFVEGTHELAEALNAACPQARMP